MESDQVILAISVDFARIEAALVNAAGGGVTYQEVAALRPVSNGKRTYLDPAQLLSTVVRAVKRLTDLKPREARRVVAVSLVGRSPSAAFVTTQGPQSVFVLPADERFAEAAAGKGIPWNEVSARVGLMRERCQIPFAVGAAGQAHPSAKMLTPKDYVKFALTGEFTTDPLDAQHSFVWDLDRREWSQDLCRTFSIAPGWLAEVRPATAPAGKITAEAARATGLKEGLPVACGMGDWGEYLGSGVFEPGDCFEHIGTTAAFYGVTGKRPGVESGLNTRPHVVDGRYLVGREGLPGGACLEWFLKKTSLARDGVIDWVDVEVELEAAAAMNRPENVLFFPNLSGEEGQVAEGAFVNLGMADDLTSFIQGIIEGVFFSLKSVAEELKGISFTPRAAFTTGQIGFKHPPRRIRANIYGIPIHAGRTPGANVMSAALVGAVACGAYADLGQARKQMLNLDGGAHPDKAAQALYEAHYASWVGTRDFLSPGKKA